MYAQVCTCPDIAFAVSMLGRYQVNPGEIQWTAGKKVLRYLKKTRDYKLVYRKGESLDVVGYSDLDHAGDKDDLKSTSGFVFLMAGGAISWDLIRCTQVVPTIERPMPIYCDNSATVFFTKNNKRSSSSKQIELEFLHVRKKIEELKVAVEDIRTTEMIADPLTKPVSVSIWFILIAAI
ncbi:secreted RxLR effector protein 161-like [Rosa chinensis]|uniref:secreted RxLR effector protein 161-like n=1 Tax=Rosa chinensis TaxID=74649 RepID=UPI001AD940C4|nr:secreted RxLR effector protein 161-like [Rosa chinensis]